MLNPLLVQTYVALLAGRADYVDGIAHRCHHDHHGGDHQGAQDGCRPRRRRGHLVLGLAHVPQVVAEDRRHDQQHRGDLEEEVHRRVAGEQAGQQRDDVAQDDSGAHHQGQVGEPTADQRLPAPGVGGNGAGQTAHQDQVQRKGDDDRRDSRGVRRGRRGPVAVQRIGEGVVDQPE